MIKRKLRYLVEDVTRHGQVRLYYRRPDQPKIRIWVPVEHPDFPEAWQAASDGRQLPKPVKVSASRARIKASSFRGLCERYYASAPFKKLTPVSQRTRRGILKHCCAEPTKPGAAMTMGEVDAEVFGSAHVKVLRDRKAGLPEAANNRVKAIRAVYAWHQEGNELARNPTKGIKLLKGRSDGFHSWSLEEVSKFESCHAIGTTARLALDLALYTSQRRSDVVRLGREHVHFDGEIAWLEFRQQKTNAEVELPIIDPLALSIAERPARGAAFLETSFGKPFTSNGIGNAFRAWCDEAGLPHCSMHGLRKATAARLAELGCSEEQIGAITGHANAKELAKYTKAARRRLLAKDAMDRLKESLQTPKKCPTSDESHAKSGTLLEEKT